MHNPQVRHIAAGCYHVDHTTALVLQASLSTCVAVALHDAGARQNRFKTAIAGAALVGPIVSRDLQLDIGDRILAQIQPVPQVALKIIRLIDEEKCESGLELERLETAAFYSILETVGLSIDQFPDMVDLIPDGVFEL
jgi:chemotaxis receptor (MCP) glutamine deamidase CheD